MDATRYWAVVPAAGVGKRMGTAIPKQYLPLAGISVIVHTLNTLIRHPRIEGVVVATGNDDPWWDSIRLQTTKPLIQVPGGKERCHSVLNALRTLKTRIQKDDWVLVHDAVRPCLRPTDLDRLMATLRDDPVGGLLATPVRDTLKRTDNEGRVAATVDRTKLWHALTPQMFRFGVLLSALQNAVQENHLVTDDASAVEAAGLTPRLVEGHPDNIKITTPGDLPVAEIFLKQIQGSQP